jgi:hypothetical protein
MVFLLKGCTDGIGLAAIMMCLLCLTFLFGMQSQPMWYLSSIPGALSSLPPSTNFTHEWPQSPITDSFTVIIDATNHDECLYQSLLHLKACSIVHTIIVSWGDTSRSPSSQVMSVAELQGNPRIIIDEEITSRKSNKFRPRQTIETEVVYHMNADVMPPCLLLDAGFKFWRTLGPEREAVMVAFAARDVFLPKSRYRHALHSEKWNTAFLTKGGFIHRNFHKLYSHAPEFAEAREIVDRAFTGEDILMSVVHAHFTSTSNVSSIVRPKSMASSSNAKKRASSANSLPPIPCKVIMLPLPPTFSICSEPNTKQAKFSKSDRAEVMRKIFRKFGNVFENRMCIGGPFLKVSAMDDIQLCYFGQEECDVAMQPI